MPDDFDPEGYFLADMSEEEKDELIQMLSQRYGTAISTVIGLHNALTVMSINLNAADVFGHRGKMMRVVAQQMEIIAAITRQHLGIDDTQLATDAAFEDIVAGLDMDEGEEDD